jgi:hypothetical protein
MEVPQKGAVNEPERSKEAQVSFGVVIRAACVGTVAEFVPDGTGVVMWIGRSYLHGYCGLDYTGHVLLIKSAPELQRDDFERKMCVQQQRGEYT